MFGADVRKAARKHGASGFSVRTQPATACSCVQNNIRERENSNSHFNNNNKSDKQTTLSRRERVGIDVLSIINDEGS